MKKCIGFIITAVLVCCFTFAMAIVEISEYNFPDPNFRQCILDSGFDTNGDGTLSDEELANVTEIWCDGKSISSLEGIENFTSLTKLYCYSNNLEYLDVSYNTNLTNLFVWNNQLSCLDVSKNTALRVLYCEENRYPSS